MRTKTIWETEDLKPGRCVIRKSSSIGAANVGFACSVAYKLCWNTTGKKWSLVAMTDGMIGKKFNQDEMLKRLNNDKFGYRPLTYAEVTVIVECCKAQIEGSG